VGRHVDVVVAAEAPSLAPHVEQMAAKRVERAHTGTRAKGEQIAVSIKPKRGEGLGAIGRTEASRCGRRVTRPLTRTTSR